MKKLKVLALVTVIIFVCIFATACGNDKAQIEELNEKIKSLENELKLYEEKIGDAFSDENKIPYGDLFENSYYEDGPEGAASVEREGDVQNSPYYKTLDFYNMESTDTLTILTNFKTIQQGTEWTCGPTSALMVLEWFSQRNGLNELDLYELRHKPQPGATSLRQMIYIFEELNAKYLAEGSTFSWDIYTTYELSGKALDYTADKAAKGVWPDEDFILNSLKDGVPVIIGDNEWGGHWYVVIGYDTMGTETTADDVLIVADPYDTTDHCQDGYTVVSFERLYYNWRNNFDSVFSQYIFLAVQPK